MLYRKALYLIKEGHTKEAYSVLEGALVMDFNKHSEIFEYMPQLRNDNNIVNLIDIFRSKKEK
ncbi:MAG TPA: hypothetical protein VK994_08195, partial [Bacteroidales bacterium]|nr:hypothetical protein [Bacteroidales bacterium]